MPVMPIVFVNGPRQAGKSTLVRHLVEAGLKADYVTFDDITTFAAASSDAEGFLRRSKTPLIIDEVQLVPAIFRVLKVLVDEYRAGREHDANGRFLLTGSANVLTLPGLADALVGRMAVLSLYPLAACEVLGQGEPVVNGLFDGDIAASRRTALKDIKPVSLADAVHRATFPEISGAERRNADLWFDGYLTTLLQRDVRALADIENIPALPNILRLLAARASGLLNDADCARDAKLNTMTYRRYRNLLMQLFLFNLVPAWHRNIGKRLIKAPKLYFTDTALLCHQLGVDLETLERRDPGLFGRVLENFVASELIKQIGMISGTALYHFRTQDGHEVDFVLERRDGSILGIEVKSSSSVTRDDFADLDLLKQKSGKDFVRGIVLYRGRNAVSFADDMIALPLEYLWTPDPG